MEDVIFPNKRDEWDQLRCNDCTVNFTAIGTDNFSPDLAVTPTRNMIRESRDYSQKNSRVQKCCACVAKPIVATIDRVTSTNSVARDSIKELWKTVKMDPCQNIAKCQKSAVNVTSTKRGFRTIHYSVATYEQTKKSVSYFYPKRIVEEDEILTKPLHL